MPMNNLNILHSLNHETILKLSDLAFSQGLSLRELVTKIVNG
jgi:hypothetical protein